MDLKEFYKLKENLEDLVIREININNNVIGIVCLETITSSDDINNFILKRMSILDSFNKNDLKEYLFNHLPAIAIEKIDDKKSVFDKLLNGWTILLINNQVLGIETKSSLSRSVSEADYERSITGPKDSFVEHYNTNIGLIRRRIKSIDLNIETMEIGRYTKTKVGILSIKGIARENFKKVISEKLKKINIDGIIDSGYIKNYLNEKGTLFPTIKETERPDLVSMSLLEGKIVLVVDNSPDALILPTFFIDYFHMSDDYYQKSINVTFIRIIRLIAFIIAIFLPGYYIAITTHNYDSLPINLLINFISQQSTVPFPSFFEGLLMIISFEILRESDMRIPSSMGTALSILGGLVLGDAAVSAGLISPIMIIVIALSAISGLIFQSIEIINAIRYLRFIIMILSSLFGLYGIFIGIIIILINLSSTNSFNKDYLYPYSPINLSMQLDGFIKYDQDTKHRSPILSDNHVRGRK